MNLIFSIPRSGSTNLLKTFTGLNKFTLNEPFKYEYDIDIINKQLHSMHKVGVDVIKHVNIKSNNDGNEYILKYPFSHIIFLYRENLKEAAISSILGNKFKYWFGNYPLNFFDNISPFSIDIDEINSKISIIEKDTLYFREFLIENNISHMSISYEDIYFRGKVLSLYEYMNMYIKNDDINYINDVINLKNKYHNSILYSKIENILDIL